MESGTYTGAWCPLSLVPKLLWTHCWNCPVNVVQHYLLMLRPTISLPSIWSWPTVALHVSGGGQTLATIAPFWRQQTSWWVCLITHKTTERLYNYLPLVFVNCYGDSTPVEGTIVDVGDMVTPMMHYDVRFHVVFVYMDWTVHHCQFSLCSKQSNLILEGRMRKRHTL